MAKFFEMEWAQLFKTALEESEKFKKESAGFTAWVSLILLPEDNIKPRALRVYFNNCKVENMEVQSFKKSDFYLASNLKNWILIGNGKLDPIKAILIGRVKFKGDLRTAIKYISAIRTAISLLKYIPTEF